MQQLIEVWFTGGDLDTVVRRLWPDPNDRAEVVTRLRAIADAINLERTS